MPPRVQYPDNKGPPIPRRHLKLEYKYQLSLTCSVFIRPFTFQLYISPYL